MPSLYFYVAFQTPVDFFNTFFMLLYDTPIIYVHFTLMKTLSLGMLLHDLNSEHLA